MLAGFLLLHGHAVLCVTNGNEALRLLDRSATRPGLIFSDLMNAGTQWRQFIAELRRDPELAEEQHQRGRVVGLQSPSPLVVSDVHTCCPSVVDGEVVPDNAEDSTSEVAERRREVGDYGRNVVGAIWSNLLSNAFI